MVAMATVRLLVDGNDICALIGIDLQSGIAGYGRTVSDALRDLADRIDEEKFEVRIPPDPNGLDRTN
jgi:hypothetical protein